MHTLVISGCYAWSAGLFSDFAQLLEDYGSSMWWLYELDFFHIKDGFVFGGMICFFTWLIQDDDRLIDTYIYTQDRDDKLVWDPGDSRIHVLHFEDSIETLTQPTYAMVLHKLTCDPEILLITELHLGTFLHSVTGYDYRASSRFIWDHGIDCLRTNNLKEGGL